MSAAVRDLAVAARAALNDVQEVKLMLHVGAEDAPTASTPGTSAEPWDVDLAKNASTEPDQVDEQMEPSSMKAKNQQCLARPNGPASRSMAMLCVCVLERCWFMWLPC